jgi:predicted nucleic acid-binding protein
VANLTAIYAACVLYPAPLRDFLMELALTDLFRARWSEDIQQEWMRNVLKNRPDLSEAQLVRTKDLMNANVRDALVTGYKSLIPSLSLPDPNDRHVLAAAIRGNASIIIATNLKD